MKTNVIFAQPSVSFADTGCESQHIDPLNSQCSGVPVAICSTCVREDFLICQSALTYMLSSRLPWVSCAQCGRLAEDCWRAVIEP